MQSKSNLIINPAKWLGDANIISMDWDCKAMLFHLIVFSTQQAQPGYLPLNETLIKKVLENPTQDEWDNRIRPQLWSVLKTKKLTIDGTTSEFLYYPEYIKSLDELNGNVEKPVKKSRKKKTDNPDIGLELNDFEFSFQGFSLETLIKAKTTTTILYEKATQEISSNIWDVGVSILLPQKKDEASCRKLLGRLIKLYGAPQVSAGIADISSKNLKAANMEAFLTGIVKSKAQALEAPTLDANGNTIQPPAPKARPTKYGIVNRPITSKVSL